MDTSWALPRIDETLRATTRYLEALTVLDDESVRRPSVLPGWSRAHVVAHLSRNADAFTQVLRQVAAGEPAWMYASTEARNADIEQTVGSHDAAGLVAYARRSAAAFEDAVRACAADPATTYTRLPDGGETWPLSSVGPRREAELEIHHADLDVGYRPDAWPPSFSTRMIEQRRRELAAGPAMTLAASDVGGTWTFGDGGPTVGGTAGALAWWLVGRGGGAGLTCTGGDLPVLGRWR